MANVFPAELTNVLDGDLQSLANIGRKLFVDVLTFTSDGTTPGTADTLRFGKRRAGEQVVAIGLAASANLSASKLAIGISGTTGKYRVAAALPNATTTFALVPSAALDDGPLTADEELIGTITDAAIPAGKLVVTIVYAAR